MLGTNFGTSFDQDLWSLTQTKWLHLAIYPFQRAHKPLQTQMATHFMQLTVILLHCTPLGIIFCSFSSRLCVLGLLSLTSYIFFFSPVLQNVYITSVRVKKKNVVQYIAPIEKQLFPLFFSKYLSLFFSTVGQTERLKGILLSISPLQGISKEENTQRH